MNKARLEAFSDGVMAIAITLLVLELHVPEHEPGHLWEGLLHERTQFVAYIISFIVIGIIWLNHHALVSMIRHADRAFLMYNLLLLFTVALLPFPTALMSSVIRHGGKDASVAAALYAMTFELMAIAFMAMWVHATRNGRLLYEPMSDAEWRTTFRRFGFGQVPYLLGIALAFVNAWLTIVLVFIAAIYYAFDQLDAFDTPEREDVEV